MSRPVLVTGAAGFAGSHLLDLVAREGAALVAWSHRASPHALPAGARCTWRAVDITDASAVDCAVAEVRPSFVYHCAGDAQSNRDASETGTTLAVNARGTANLLSAVARHAPDARVIVTGSALVYHPSTEVLREDSPIGPAAGYGLSKLAQETLALRAASFDNLDVIVVRAFNHIGPRQSPAFVASSVARQIALMESGRQVPQLMVGNLEVRRDVTDVRDTVRAYQALAARGASGGVYNVCSGEAPSVRTLVDRLVARARVTVQVVVDPGRLRPVDVPVLIGSHERLTRDTLWQPEIPLDRTLDDLLNWWREKVAGIGA